MVVLARIVTAIVIAVVGILVAGILLRVLGTNPAHPVVNFVDQAAAFLVTPFASLFLLPDNKLEVALNWGIGAFVYFVIGALLVLLLRVGGRRPKT